MPSSESDPQPSKPDTETSALPKNDTEPQGTVRFIKWSLRKLGVSSRYLARHSFRTAGHLLRALAYGFAGSTLMLIAIGVTFLNGRPDLSDWHTLKLHEEFDDKSPDRSFTDYLEREDRLFAEMDEEIYGPAPQAIEGVIHRYQPGSLANPREFERDWNRTFEMVPNEGIPATAGILLLHGMSDSPYSLLHLGEAFHARGAHVIGLRIPGHGTIPSGLTRVEWEDMAAAVRLAMRHLGDENGPDVPLYLVGYSNGGALSVNYALESLEEEELPTASGIVLLSPAIGVTPMAAIAPWQARLGRLLGLQKLAWNSINPEYDPYKYVSFAVNAGYQVRRLTIELGEKLEQQAREGRLNELPPILAFQSIVDSTVSTPALIERLFALLPAGKHELVLFDINRSAGLGGLLRGDPTATVDSLIARDDAPYALTLIGNRDSSARDIVTRSFGKEGILDGEPQALATEWPRGVYSLSHVALPFPGVDPFYGNPDLFPEAASPLNLGNLSLRGENGVLRISPADQLRLRWNPFYPYLESRVLDFFALPGEPTSSGSAVP